MILKKMLIATDFLSGFPSPVLLSAPFIAAYRDFSTLVSGGARWGAVASPCFSAALTWLNRGRSVGARFSLAAKEAHTLTLCICFYFFEIKLGRQIETQIEAGIRSIDLWPCRRTVFCIPLMQTIHTLPRSLSDRWKRLWLWVVSCLFASLSPSLNGAWRV